MYFLFIILYKALWWPYLAETRSLHLTRHCSTVTHVCLTMFSLKNSSMQNIAGGHSSKYYVQASAVGSVLLTDDSKSHLFLYLLYGPLELFSSYTELLHVTSFFQFCNSLFRVPFICINHYPTNVENRMSS
jgi:hypothetical protein